MSAHTSGFQKNKQFAQLAEVLNVENFTIKLCVRDNIGKLDSIRKKNNVLQ